ncbi:MAG TPA: ThiF family adenylyltransferase [Pirellulales bacterium]|nr:ThiF family adenylyltransferase [Pirellulales bacterium]
MPQDAQATTEGPISDRYSRQIRFAPLGEEGQRRLLASRVLVCGCGALGSVLANTLARAGVGRLRIVDRDFVETSNLQRQVLFDEDDVAANLPKAVAAAQKLRRINSEIEIEPVVADVDHKNILALLDGVDCLVDGTDNFETRFLINDATISTGTPWVYGGSIGAGGQTMTILPGETPCLRCLISEPPPPGSTETCDTAGILGPIVNVIASIQANEAIKILAGRREAVQRSLLIFDLWENRFLAMKAAGLLEGSECPACVRRELDWLSGRRGTHTAVLCGRNAVQLAQPARVAVSLDAVAQKLSVAGVGRVARNPFLLRFAVDGYTITLFPDGRAIIGGTSDLAAARTVYAKYIGA